MPSLLQLHADIDRRVTAIRAERADWPCSKGCAQCCRRLAEVPTLSAAEWQLLQQGLAALPRARLAAIAAAMAALPTARPVTCPLLDAATDACLVYAERPVACRSYGFYVQRELGLYCADIEARVADGRFAEVVWGNHDAVDGRLATLGDKRPLTDCFAAWYADL